MSELRPLTSKRPKRVCLSRSFHLKPVMFQQPKSMHTSMKVMLDPVFLS